MHLVQRFLSLTRFRPLSPKMWVDLPRREIERRSAVRNVSVMRYVANSKLIAKVTRQTKRETYPFFFRGFRPLCILSRSGQSQSHTVFSNRYACRNRKSGKSAVYLSVDLWRWRKHLLQACVSWRIKIVGEG